MSRGQDAFLQVVGRVADLSPAASPGLASFGLCRPGRGLLQQGVDGQGGSWRAAGQEFPEVIGPDHPATATSASAADSMLPPVSYLDDRPPGLQSGNGQ
jgi:hypothetical protein